MDRFKRAGSPKDSVGIGIGRKEEYMWPIAWDKLHDNKNIIYLDNKPKDPASKYDYRAVIFQNPETNRWGFHIEQNMPSKYDGDPDGWRLVPLPSRNLDFYLQPSYLVLDGGSDWRIENMFRVFREAHKKAEELDNENMNENMNDNEYKMTSIFEEVLDNTYKDNKGDSSFEIIGVSDLGPEVLDTAKSEEEAKQKTEDLQTSFGSLWKISYKPVSVITENLDFERGSAPKKVLDIGFENVDYSMAHEKMDKFLPDDEDVQNEYYELLDDESVSDSEKVNHIAEFLSDFADEDRMQDYFEEDGNIEGFARYIIKNK